MSIRSLALAALLAVSACALTGSAQESQPATNPAERNAQISALHERAAGLERRGDPSAAAELYKELQRIDPTNADWVLAGGRALGLAGRYNDALDALEAVRKRFPDVLEIPALIARTYDLKAEAMLAQGVRDGNVMMNFESAIQYADGVLEKDPAHRDARLIKAQSLYAMGEGEKALVEAKECVKRFPAHPGGVILVGKLAFDRFALLRTDAQAQKNGSKEQAESLQQAAAARDEAARWFTKAAELDPERPFPLTKLGDIEAWQGKVPQALEFYGKALELDPEAGVNHAWITRNAPADQAEKLYGKALESYAHKPNPIARKGATLLWYHGYVLLQLKEWKRARQRFEEAVLANPNFQNSLYWAAHAAFWDGDHDGALKNAGSYATANAGGFADVLKALPEAEREESLRLMRFLAARAYEKGATAASRDLNHVVAFLEEKPESWNNYAFLCRETGKYQDSFDAYVHALELEPNSPQLLNDAAVILQYHLQSPENLAKARTWYQKAISEAETVLASAKSSAEQKKLATQARQDARGNLAKLR